MLFVDSRRWSHVAQRVRWRSWGNISRSQGLCCQLHSLLLFSDILVLKTIVILVFSLFSSQNFYFDWFGIHIARHKNDCVKISSTVKSDTMSLQQLVQCKWQHVCSCDEFFGNKMKIKLVAKFFVFYWNSSHFWSFPLSKFQFLFCFSFLDHHNYNSSFLKTNTNNSSSCFNFRNKNYTAIVIVIIIM